MFTFCPSFKSQIGARNDLNRVSSAAWGFIPERSQEKDTFPISLLETRIVSHSIGGTTGAKLVETLKDKNLYVKKGGKEQNSGQIQAEYYANRIYQILKIPVPPIALYDLISSQKLEQTADKTQVVLLSKFIHGDIVELGNYLREDKTHLKEVQQIVKKGFVADCLLANWDIAGADFDNLLIDRETKTIWRIDLGGTLEYRAQGAKKNPQFFTSHVQEIQTMRNPSVNYQAAQLYASVTYQDICEQIEQITAQKQAILSILPRHLRELMSSRIDNLVTYIKA